MRLFIDRRKVVKGFVFRPGAFVVSKTSHTTPLFTLTPKIVDSEMAYYLDASFSLAGDGIDLSRAVFEWTFADGSTANGKSVSKTFSKAGIQDVKLTITDEKGNVSTLIKEKVKVLSTLAVDLDFENGLLDAELGLLRTFTASTPRLVQTEANQSLIVGGKNGHIYFPPTDPSLSAVKSNREMTISMSFNANRDENSGLIPLVMQHGGWNMRIDPVLNTIRISPGATVKLPERIVTGEWVDLSFTWAENSLNVYVNGKPAGRVDFSSSQFNQFLDSGRWGLGIGGSGPWLDSRNKVKFGIDNLKIHAVALKSEQILEIRKSNLLTR